VPLVEIQFSWHISLSGPKVYQENYQCFYVSLFCFVLLKLGIIQLFKQDLMRETDYELMTDMIIQHFVTLC